MRLVIFSALRTVLDSLRIRAALTSIAFTIPTVKYNTEIKCDLM